MKSVNYHQNVPDPETPLRPPLIWSLILHAALVAFLWGGEGASPPHSVMTVEIGELAPTTVAAPQQAIPSKVVPTPFVQPAPQAMARERTVAPASLSSDSLPATGSDRGTGALPDPLPFPIQQRRLRSGFPFSPYSSSR